MRPEPPEVDDLDHPARQAELLAKIERHVRFLASIVKLLVLLMFVAIGGVILRFALYYLGVTR